MPTCTHVHVGMHAVKNGERERRRARLQPADWPKGFTLKTSLREREREAVGVGGKMAKDRGKEK